MAEAPSWAAELVRVTCLEAGIDPPHLRWRRRRRLTSSGVARRAAGSISIVAGSDPLDQRLTLLHELAHWIAPAPRRGRTARHHGLAFYRVAFRLYRRNAIPDAAALRGEAARYPSSLRHAAALGLPGATELLAERRAVLSARARREWRILVPEHAVRLRRDGRWMVCEICRQRVVGANLARIRRARRPVSHVLMTAVPA